MTRTKRIVTGILVGSFFLLAATSPTEKAPKPFILVLDAGHGGKDPGNLGTGKFKTTEKDISLDVTLMLGKYIEEAFPDVKIVYTRKGDSFPTLKNRVEIANSNHADLFISIHCNSFTNNASGSETFVMGMHKSEESLRSAMKENASIYLEDNYKENYAGFDPKDPDTYIALSLRQNVNLDQSLYLSKEIQDQFRERVGRKDRGVKQAGYYVISFTTMPSVLVELGFLTNAEEEKFLNSEQGKTYMSSAIFRAFKTYKDLMDGVEGTMSNDNNPIEKTVAEEITKESANKVVEVEKPLPPKNTKETKESTSEVIWEDCKNGVRYQVQVLTSSKPVEKSAENFFGLHRVDEYLSDDIYKYVVGSTNTYTEAKQNLQTLKDIGFKGAFIVAFRGESRIQLHEALSLENQ